MSRSVTLACAVVVTIVVSYANAEKPVDVIIGESQFFNGDTIDILSVTSTGEGFELGATVTVEGTYKLNSTKSALLAFYSTKRLKPGGKSMSTPNQRSQSTTARNGAHVFVLSKKIVDDGSPHITFYNSVTGKPFGGVYFGDESNVMMKKSWSYEPEQINPEDAPSKIN